MKAYLDNAATTSLAPEVLEAMLPFMRNGFGNPSSTHSHGREVKTAVEKARRSIAELLNAYPSEIYFTSGGTEADNTFLRGVVKMHKVKYAISSQLEHHAVLHTLEALEREGLIALKIVENDCQGKLNLSHLESLLKESPNALVSLMHANNEIGNINPIAKIAELCKEYNAYFHSDTVQTIGYYQQDVKKLPVDSLVGAGHKFHGPKGVGFMYLRKGLKISSFITGGGQERNMRGGTENTYGIIGLAKALELSLSTSEKSLKYMNGLKNYMIEQITHTLGNTFIYNGMSGDVNESLPSVLNIGVNSSQASMLLFNLDLHGISVSGGSACSSGSHVGSHVIAALSEQSKAHAPIRFSFSKYTTKDEIAYTVSKLKELLVEKAIFPM